jgi:hypothetical protein
MLWREMMKRRKFFGLLAGLTGVGAMRKPKSPATRYGIRWMGPRLYKITRYDWCEKANQFIPTTYYSQVIDP